MNGQPEIWRPIRGRIRAWFPWPGEAGLPNREWLHDELGHGISVIYREREWHLARDHYQPLVHAAAARWGRVRVHEEYGDVDKCTASCQQARRDERGVYECTCVCGGENHAGGIGRHGWKEVGDGELLVASSGRFWRTFVVRGR